MELKKDDVPVYELGRRNTLTEIAEYIRHNCLVPSPIDEAEEHVNDAMLSLADHITKMGAR